jgi:hypothetical protein
MGSISVRKSIVLMDGLQHRWRPPVLGRDAGLLARRFPYRNPLVLRFPSTQNQVAQISVRKSLIGGVASQTPQSPGPDQVFATSSSETHWHDLVRNAPEDHGQALRRDPGAASISVRKFLYGNFPTGAHPEGGR